MIDELVAMGALSRVRTDTGLVGYRFFDTLHQAYEEVDSALTGAVSPSLQIHSHSCTSLLEKRILEKINFFDTLPVVPLHAIPHTDDSSSPRHLGWVLAPSTCYHTFAHLEGTRQQKPLEVYTARGTCHRYEPNASDETRLGNFTMREFIFIGSKTDVENQAEETFSRQLVLLERLLGKVVVEAASDIFYGRMGRVARSMQLASAAKLEGRTAWGEATISVASRNLHHTLFTNAFDIVAERDGDILHSACVAFGIERILLTAMSRLPVPDPERLLNAIRLAKT